MNGDPRVWGLWCTLARVACDRAKGVCLIIITAVLWGLFQIQGVEVAGVWGLIEDGIERWERWLVSMCPYATGMEGISKRNFHLGQVSPSPQDVSQGWMEWWRPAQRHTGIEEEAQRLLGSVCQKVIEKLSNYAHWQKIWLINLQIIEVAGRWWCHFEHMPSAIILNNSQIRQA